MVSAPSGLRESFIGESNEAGDDARPPLAMSEILELTPPRLLAPGRPAPHHETQLPCAKTALPSPQLGYEGERASNYSGFAIFVTIDRRKAASAILYFFGMGMLLDPTSGKRLLKCETQIKQRTLIDIPITTY